MLPLTKEICSQIQRLLVFVGMPASGKSTMAQILLLLLQALNHGKRHKEYRLLTMSSLIGRELDDPKSTLRPLILPFVPDMKAGKLLNDELTMKTLDKHLVREYWEGGRIMLLDGCIRNIVQGEAILDTGIRWELVHLKVDDEQLSLDRIARRAIGEGRDDDASPERVAERLKNYREQTFPVLGQFWDQNCNLTHEINAALEFESRVQMILSKISSVVSMDEVAEMMRELRKPGTPANNLMRKTLGLQLAAPSMLTMDIVTTTA